nr:hypothetical protein [Tanacetum cinerariifolium]
AAPSLVHHGRHAGRCQLPALGDAPARSAGRTNLAGAGAGRVTRRAFGGCRQSLVPALPGGRANAAQRPVAARRFHEPRTRQHACDAGVRG